MTHEELVESCKVAAKTARDAHLNAPLSRCYGVIVEAVIATVAAALEEPTEEMVRRHLAVRKPRTYRTYLRHPLNGPLAKRDTENDIATATAEWQDALSVSPLFQKKDKADD